MARRRQNSLKSTRIVVMAALSIASAGCDDWPRYANKPSTEADALTPDAPPSDGIRVAWSEPTADEETGDGPGAAEGIGLLEGIIRTGELTGLGWDVDATASRVSECDNALAFPPDAPGTYTGDVDWITVETAETGVLCLSLQTEIPDDTSEEALLARVDAVLYTLDDCNEPVALYVEDGTSNPIGADMPAGSIDWAIGVQAETVVSVGIAGFWPDDETLALPWTAHLSFVPGINAAPSALCPEVDE